MPYKEKTGGWRGVVKSGGERITRRFATKRDAGEWERAERKRRDAGAPLIRLGFLDLSTKYLEFTAARFVGKTHNEKLHIIREFGSFLGGDMDAEAVTPAQVNDYMLEISRSRSPNAANKHRKNLSAMWTWGIKILGLESNPWQKTEKFTHERSKKYIPPREDILRVLAVSSGEDRVMLLCYLNTGARRTEVFRLRWDDVDFAHRRIRLWTRKTRGGAWREDWLPLSAQLHDSLEWWRANTPFPESEFVFVARHRRYKGEPFRDYRMWIQRLCERAGVERFGYHALRHHVASFLADEGVPMRRIQEVLRHQRLSTTEGYLHGLGRDLSDTMEILGTHSGTHDKKKGPAENG